MTATANMIPFQKLFTKSDAACGNVFRVVWNDGTETGYPTEEIRDRAIEAVAA